MRGAVEGSVGGVGFNHQKSWGGRALKRILAFSGEQKGNHIRQTNKKRGGE